MRVRVATEGLQFVVVQVPVQKVDREGRQKADARTGALLWQVSVVPLGDDFMREALTVTVDAEPKVTLGEFVSVADLVASTWEQGDRWGVAFRATSISPAKPGSRPAPAQPSAA